MAVNGVEIAAGQVWRTREGEETIPLRQSDDKTYPFWDDRIMSTWGSDGLRFAGRMDASDLIELVTDEHGFTIWKGGECPLAAGQYADLRFRSGGTSSMVGAGSEVRWQHEGTLGDITAYKVVEVAEQPAATVDADKLASETLSALGWVFDGTTWVEQPRIEMIEGGVPAMAVPGYELLADVLKRAYDQAAVGKGKERHANGEPFDEQVMQDGARRFGVGALLFQAFKKSEESQRLPLERGVAELLGSIVYLAGAVIRREADDPTKGVF